MTNVYIIDEFQKDSVLEQIDNARTFQELKDAVRALLELLPVEYVR